MAYENYEQAIMLTYSDQLRAGQIITPEQSDLQSSKAQRKYSKYLRDIACIKPTSYKRKDFRVIGQESVLELTLEILMTIFGEDIYPNVIEFFQHLYVNGSDDALDGISLNAKNKLSGEIYRLVEIPGIEDSSSPVTIAHEFMHFYLKGLNIDIQKKLFYEEILSIYAEKVAYWIIEKNISEPKFAQKIEETRLECIDWHYSINLPAVEETISGYNSLKNKKQKNFFDFQLLDEMERKIPLIKTAEGISALRGFYNNKAASYGIGYLYGESIFQRFLDSPIAIREQLDKVIAKEQSVEGLLEYYGISARNYQTYNEVNQRLELIRKSK